MLTISLKDKNYPQLLKEIYGPPKQLYCLGKLKSKEKFPLAVVGTRKISFYGKKTTEYFVNVLVQAGLTIISGLALGIDGLAHQIALENHGRTLAVLGSGLDIIYPPKHKKLAKEIIKSGGALLSEYPPKTRPSKLTFPARNRIVSGLSLGVLVIEAPIKSGALITARFALEQGREVFAVPGGIYNENSQGCNFLIKMGAKPVTKPEEILEILKSINQ
ncbi:MAG: DNA-processing protein DprA [Patescibacteria group bacterium]|jgi:DNA processing protein|nr:DNA-processing protein DprA [Patescibacteria group bacterium]MDD5172996.1 DNA-processing protein DprA [Patescibacteria group bacterium]